MECTQRLEYTQEISDTQSERPNPEQIGFLGICGSKYPVHKGPNKIGRDPETCNIILNLNSVSRQHAVINILSKKDFMLMDLDSANKTKLSGQVLKPYIPHSLHNGDTIQFGEIFGIFRLLEEEDDLPMTQAIDIPDTPVPTRHMSRVNAVTTIPESPDVSDKEDSFIVPSQPKSHQFQSAKTRNFIKPGKTISIQPVGTNKIDNIYWNSSNKSTSLNLEDSDCSLNDSIQAVKLNDKENKVSNDIHELDTQEVFPGHKVNNSAGSINTANTQLPDFDDGRSVHTANTQMPDGTSSPSIHSLNTQMPSGTSPSIHNINTQMPETFGSPSIHCLNTQLPEVCKINDQQDMHFDLCANKNNNDSIYNAETQPFSKEMDNILVISRSVNDSPVSIKSNHDLNKSNEELVFDEVDSQSLAESQAILSDDMDLPINRLVEEETDSQSQIIKPKCAKKNMRIKSDSSTDCDDNDMIQTQKILIKKCDDGDTTDCEEEIQLNIKENEINVTVSPKPTELFEDVATQIIELDEGPSKTNIDVDIEDMPTQVLDIDDVEKEKIYSNTEVDFEDLPTQVLDDDIPPKTNCVDQLLSNKKEISPFKVPSNSVLKAKRRDSKTPKIKLISAKDIASNTSDKNYYHDTQDLYDDLCTQRLEPAEDTKSLNKSLSDISVGDMEEKVNDFVSNLSSQEVRDVIGVGTPVSQLKKIPSDESTPSDVELTPKKRPFKFVDIDLPNSQEIKTTVSVSNRSMVTESSSESDTENNSEDQYTPILFRKKKKVKPEAKLDLTKKFDVEALPSRVITRVRKPTAKVLAQGSKKATDNILKPKFLTEQDVEIDKEIITENITRLKNKNEKSKSAKTNDSNKETNQAKFTEENIITNVKKGRNGGKKNEENVEKNIEKLPINVRHSCKEETRKKKEPTHTKKEVIDSKQSPITRKTTKQSLDSTVNSKDKTQLSNKSKETVSFDLTDSPVETKRSTRSTRNSKTKDKITKAESKSPEKDSHTDKPAKRKYTRKKQELKVDNRKEVEKEPSPEMLVRRSKRQRTIKENKEPVIKSILKNSLTVHEESAVYNVSSGSNSDSSRTFKRPALDDSEPSPKRTRSMAMNNTVARAAPSKTLKTQYVLFTAFPYETVKVKLEQLGAVVVTDVLSCTVLLTQQIKRTFKLLCAIGLGKPIVGPSWVQACAEANMIVDPWLYLMKDEVAEKRFDFSLERTLTGKRDYLKGYNVSSTPRVMPMAHEMKLIVECSGGSWKVGGPQWICVSTRDDRALWPALRAKGATIVTTEFILSGVLRQRIEIDANKCK